MLEAAGWQVRLVDALSIDDPATVARLGPPRRDTDGTGKLFRERVTWPAPIKPVERSYGRYGILGERLSSRIAEAAASLGGPPDVTLVTSGMTYWYPGVVEAVRRARAIVPTAPVVVGGTYASLLPEHCAVSTGSDLVVDAGPSTAPAGGAGGCGDRLSAFLVSRGLPAPEATRAPAVVANGRGSAAVRLNDGCPYRCDYCASHHLAPRFTPGSPDHAFEEVRRLHEEAGVSNFAFYDDALLVSKRSVFHRFLELAADRWAGGGPRFHLPNAVHMRHLTLETARLMHAAGVREVRLGYESDSRQFHEAHDAGCVGGAKTAGGGLEAAVAVLTEAGFARRSIGVYVLAGLPGQRRAEVEHSVHVAGGTGVNVYVSEFSPVPGSPIWERCVAECELPIAEEPLYQNNTLLPMAWEGFTRQDLVAVKELAARYRRAHPRNRLLNTLGERDEAVHPLGDQLDAASPEVGLLDVETRLARHVDGRRAPRL
jgi:radical SAM superfamily enzyme YgiQ (UPF0313 family)